MWREISPEGRVPSVQREWKGDCNFKLRGKARTHREGIV